MFERSASAAQVASAPMKGVPGSELLARLEVAPGPKLAELLVSTDPAECRGDVVVAEVQAWERMAAWVAAGQARAIAKLARLRPHPGTDVDGLTPLEGQVSPYVEDELAVALRQSRYAASARLTLALQLDELPATMDALAAGRIDVARARAICSVTAPLPPELAAAVEAQVLPGAPGKTASELWAALRKAVIEAGPAEADQRHISAVSERKVRVYPGEEGMAILWALLPAPEAVALHRHLTGLARRFPPAPREHPSWPQSEDAASAQLSDLNSTVDEIDPHGRTLDQRRADALVHLGALARHLTPAGESAESHDGTCVTGACGTAGPEISGPSPGRAAGACTCAGSSSVRVPLTSALHADVQIVVAATTLLGLDDQPAHLGGYGPIPAGLGR